MESLLLFTMSHTVPALKCHTYTDHMWDMAKWTNMSATAVNIDFPLSINFFFKSYLNNTSLTSMWTPILTLHLYEITRQKTNSPIIMPRCAPYNLGQKHCTAKAHKEVLEQFFRFGIQSSPCLYLASYWSTCQFTTVTSFSLSETWLSRDILVILFTNCHIT